MGRGKCNRFQGGIKTGPSLPLLGNRMLDSNALELALHCMYSDTSEGDLKELQNRVRGDLASTIHDLRRIFWIWRVPILVPQVRARVWAGDFREFATESRWNRL